MNFKYVELNKAWANVLRKKPRARFDSIIKGEFDGGDKLDARGGRLNEAADLKGDSVMLFVPWRRRGVILGHHLHNTGKSHRPQSKTSVTP
jgi:hypothetical protein